MVVYPKIQRQLFQEAWSSLRVKEEKEIEEIQIMSNIT